jgi:hypothetical protein
VADEEEQRIRAEHAAVWAAFDEDPSSDPEGGSRSPSPPPSTRRTHKKRSRSRSPADASAQLDQESIQTDEELDTLRKRHRNRLEPLERFAHDADEDKDD